VPVDGLELPVGEAELVGSAEDARDRDTPRHARRVPRPVGGG
jgi:hypothetical protein